MPSPSDASSSFLRWQLEAEKHWRAGDYAWMASLLNAERVLEIGCGVGYSTLALRHSGLNVLTLEPNAVCRDMATGRLCQAGFVSSDFVAESLGDMTPAALRQIENFAPDWLVCWLMGAPDSALDRSLPAAQAVQKYREAVHRQVAELAVRLPSVQGVHLVDRTAFPWKIKETARETLVFYHEATSFAGLPLKSLHSDTCYRKLDERQWPAPAGRATQGIVPVLGSLRARRTAV